MPFLLFYFYAAAVLFIISPQCRGSVLDDRQSGSICIGFSSTAPLQEKDLKDIGNDPEPWAASHKSNLLFMYDTFHYVTVNNFGTATIDGQPVQEGNDLKKALCSCTLTVPDDLTGTINLYFAYRGGSNNTGVTNWTIKNLNFKVTEYK